VKINSIGKYCRHQNPPKNEELWLCRIEDRKTLDVFIARLVECYKNIFAGYPYFENYTGQEKTFIEPLMESFLDDGILVVVLNSQDPHESEVIGFAAGIRADKSEIADFLADKMHLLPCANITNLFYMAEVATIEEFRKQGIATLLTEFKISEVQNNPEISHIIMRTAAQGSNSAGIYYKLGFEKHPDLTQEKNEFDTQSVHRIFLCRKA
jgi:ribosomal protein S18 acetylase RimI-like enzyme